MKEALLIVLLAAVIVLAAYMTVRRSRRGGGCCGEHELPEKSIAVKDRKKSGYPYSARLKVTGMTCSNCAKRVENALNSQDGIWARVDLNSGIVRVRMKQDTDAKLLCSIIAKAGYSAEPK